MAVLLCNGRQNERAQKEPTTTTTTPTATTPTTTTTRCLGCNLRLADVAVPNQYCSDAPPRLVAPSICRVCYFAAFRQSAESEMAVGSGKKKPEIQV